MTLPVALSPVVPLPRPAAEASSSDTPLAPQDSRPARYWDVFGACWRPCPSHAPGAAAAGDEGEAELGGEGHGVPDDVRRPRIGVHLGG
jgi:hypothetical protein